MPLTEREKMIILVTNAIISYSKKMEEGELPKNQSIVDYILKSIPEESKPEISMELIDDVFSQISK
ncbi:MAG TPA: hypothetical protein VLD38_05205 [Nitrosopumilaceae archaeon]|nr:hypothetical protein [Nitrosopumilaceae archaeon]